LIGTLQRRQIAPEKRRPFHLIVDEFQSFSSESFATLQSEARKYGVDIIVAHQYRDQLDELNQGSTLNVANLAVMRVSGKDSFDLAGQFDNTPPEPDKTMEPIYQYSDQSLVGIEEMLYEVFSNPSGSTTLFREKELPRRLYSDVQGETANQLSIQPNFTAHCRLVGDKGGLEECLITTLPPQGTPDPEAAAYIRRRSLELGTPREEVEAAIAAKIGDFEPDKIAMSEGPGVARELATSEGRLARYGDRREREEAT
jgi:hypothetical protein